MWHYRLRNQEFGPVDTPHMLAIISQNPGDIVLVKCEGMERYKPSMAVSELNHTEVAKALVHAPPVQTSAVPSLPASAGCGAAVAVAAPVRLAPASPARLAVAAAGGLSAPGKGEATIERCQQTSASSAAPAGRPAPPPATPVAAPPLQQLAAQPVRPGQLPAAGELMDYATYDQIQRERKKRTNAMKNSIMMFLLALACVAAALKARTMPEPLMIGGFMVFMLGAVFAVFYLPLRWRAIASLPAPLMLMGFLGGLGLIGMVGLAVVAAVVVK